MKYNWYGEMFEQREKQGFITLFTRVILNNLAITERLS